ncbi:transposable element Tcb2 transposase [Trichonephila clavipes]|nr:transposable element Tcb2 transposase [Trichonephila clavipes]
MFCEGNAEADTSTRRHGRQYKQVTEYERGRIMAMMEAGWLARDKSIFNLSNDDSRARVWRLHVKRPNPDFALHGHTTPTAGVVVWDVIYYGTRSPLILTHSTTIAQRYVYTILQSHVLPLMAQLPGDIFQQDNARSHTARMP